MANNSQVKKGLTTTHKILIGGFLVIIALIVGLFLYFNKKAPVEEAEFGVINEANYAEVAEEVNDKLAKTSFQTAMTTDWIFPSGTVPSSSAVIGNSAHNNYPFYFTVELADTGEEIYKSGLIPVGKSLKEVVLDKALAAGEYEGLLRYHLVDDTNNNEEIPSNLSFSINITVQS